jgi:uncharacterized protein
LQQKASSVRIVLDTNVLVSALIVKDSVPSRVLSYWHAGKYQLVTSNEQIEELERVLSYGKISTRIQPEEAIELVHRLRTAAVLASHLPDVNFSGDPDDNIILATAVAGSADLLISGDTKHLLPLGEVEEIPIVTPAEALERLALLAGE